MHCHDWPTAPVTYAGIGNAKAVFTIHNLNYGQDLIGRAMQASSVATTVSPTYATEVSRFDNGLSRRIYNPSAACDMTQT